MLFYQLNVIMWLKFKILIGYAILILFLVLILYLFRKEQTKRSGFRKLEKELVEISQLAGDNYAALLELSSRAEVAVIWKDEDLKEYHHKRQIICDSLQLLKEHVSTPQQAERIDSLCLLLWNKELLLSKAMETFDELQGVGNLVQREIPAIVSTVQKQYPGFKKYEISSSNPQSNDVPRRKWKLLDIFYRKEKKSAYLRQKEWTEREFRAVSGMSSSNPATRMLHSLNDNISRQQEYRQARLLEQMDSLYANSVDLNHRMNSLVSDFEKELNGRLATRYQEFVLERDNSYYIAGGLALSVSLLAILLYSIIHRDLNRRNRYEKKLEDSDSRNRELLRSRKEMMFTVAHDLRAPLAAIKGCAELLPGENDNERRNEHMDNIVHSSDYMLSLVNTLMEYYQLDTDGVQSSLSIFNLEVLFREIAGGYRLLSMQKELVFTTHFSCLDVIIEGDRFHIRQIVENLLSNALKFTFCGEIRLEAEYNTGELCFSVEDTGIGMNECEKGRIFGAFERLEGARNIPGFGLGLAITARLVSEMKGRIELESSPGNGSRFSVFLPLPPAGKSTRLAEYVVHANSFPEPPGGIRVLVIDDDLIQQGIMRDMFFRNRIICYCCTDIRELTILLKEREYDLLFTDIQMPDFDGFSVLALLRASNLSPARELPVVAVSARPGGEEEYLRAGFAGCIHKPFSMERLLDVTLQCVKGRKREWQPDFSLLLTGEDNRGEMLGLFISESQKELGRLLAALEDRDVNKMSAILHKNLPLWETVRLDYSLEDLKELVDTDLRLWTESDYMKVTEIIKSVGKLITAAQEIKKTE